MIATLSLLAIGVFAAAAVADLAWRRIPNRLALGLAGLGLARIALALGAGAGLGALGADAAAAAALFLLGAFAFRFGLFGGGDVKLLAAGALWVGAAGVDSYLFATALAGGLLALGFLAWTRLGRPAEASRVSLPYGVAIAAGGILQTASGL